MSNKRNQEYRLNMRSGNSTGYPVHELQAARNALISELTTLTLFTQSRWNEMGPRLGFNVETIDRELPTVPLYDLWHTTSVEESIMFSKPMQFPEVSTVTTSSGSQPISSKNTVVFSKQKAKGTHLDIKRQVVTSGDKLKVAVTTQNSKVGKNCVDCIPPSPSLKRSNSQAEVDSEDKNCDSKNLISCYFCDFCSVQNVARSVLEEHLSQGQHYSASLYLCTNEGKKFKAVSLEQKLAITNKHGKFKCAIVTCPDCWDIFEDIFMCGYHYRTMHNSRVGYYVICEVIKTEVKVLEFDSKVCQKCNAIFDKRAQLHKHWKNMNHWPYPLPPDICFALFECPYCNKIIYKNFLAAQQHIQMHSRHQSKQRALTIKHVLKSKERNTVLDNTSVIEDNLKGDIKISQSMINFLKNVNGSTTKRKCIHETMNGMKSLRKGILGKSPYNSK